MTTLATAARDAPPTAEAGRARRRATGALAAGRHLARHSRLGFAAGIVLLLIVLAAAAAPRPAGRRASDLLAAFRGLPVEAVALSPDREAAARWLRELRHVRLHITGGDLVAAGVQPGPEVGRRLDKVLRAVLDGEVVPGRSSELAAALAA